MVGVLHPSLVSADELDRYCHLHARIVLHYERLGLLSDRMGLRLDWLAHYCLLCYHIPQRLQREHP